MVFKVREVLTFGFANIALEEAITGIHIANGVLGGRVLADKSACCTAIVAVASNAASAIKAKKLGKKGLLMELSWQKCKSFIIAGLAVDGGLWLLGLWLRGGVL